MTINTEPKPFLKWAGGKRQLMVELEARVPNYDTYYEPFVGGGALLFNLKPKVAHINDSNTELMNVYKVIRDDLEPLLYELSILEKKNNKEDFYKIRKLDRTEEFKKLSRVKKAARTIYLNKTCFNGLYRVNKKGQFNVSFANYKNPKIKDTDNLRAVSKYLNENNIKITSIDYKEVLHKIDPEENAFVYLDPPYVPLDEQSFTSYTKDGFGRVEQLELKKECDRLDALGIKFLHSNSNTPFIYENYSEYNIETVKASRAINSNAKGRGKIKEVLINNYL